MTWTISFYNIWGVFGDLRKKLKKNIKRFVKVLSALFKIHFPDNIQLPLTL